MSKIIKVLRRIEVALLVFFIGFGRRVAALYQRARNFLAPKLKAYWKMILLAVVILYAIGGVVFGIRLYKQQRFEKVDLIASYVYPFPVSSSGRALVVNSALQRWVSSSKTFAQKNNMEIPADLPQQIVQELADYKMVAQEADRMGVKLSKKEIDEKFAISIEGIGSVEQARDFIKQMYGISLEQFKSMIKPMILTEKVREDNFVRIKVRHILIKDEGKAKEVQEEIKKGGNFDEIAKDRSEDQGSKDDYGQLAGGEFLYRGSGLVQEFEDAAFKLKAGQVSDLVKTEFGYHLIKVDEKKGTINKSLEDWMGDLKKKYPQRIWI